MRLHLLSDLHLNHQEPLARMDFIRELEPEGADVCVLAGDILSATDPLLVEAFGWLAQKYRYVLYVPGNHEFYGTTPEEGNAAIVRAAIAVNRALGRQIIQTFTMPARVVLEGQPFYCGTLWFRDQPDNEMYAQHINEFRLVKKFTEGTSLAPGGWVYEQQRRFEAGLADVDSSYVVVSHHLPSDLSTPARYKKSPLNRFFVCALDEEIQKRQPKLWLHGHTHDPCDYTIGATRVVCHPRGYPKEKPGWATYRPRIIDL